MRRLIPILVLFFCVVHADAALLLKQNTVRNVRFFLADSADHITGKVSLSPTVVIAKDGAGFGAPAGAVTEVGGAGNGYGWYQLAATAVDTGTLGQLVIHASAAGADPADLSCEVVAFDPQIVPATAADTAAAVWATVTKNVTGVVTVFGNVQGKVLGGGIDNITGTGAKVSLQNNAVNTDTVADGAIDASAIATGAIPSASDNAAAVWAHATSVAIQNRLRRILALVSSR